MNKTTRKALPASVEMLESRLLMAAAAIDWSTFLGGAGSDAYHGTDVAVDSAGSVYVVGETNSTNFPTAGYPALNAANGTDAFVSKFSPAGQLQWTLFITGNDYDKAVGVAIGSDGALYVAGTTYSSNLPGAVNAMGGLQDGFLTKITVSAGNVPAINWSMYIGGASIFDEVMDVAADDSGGVYLTGLTRSADFPTLRGFDLVLENTAWDQPFVMKVAAAGAPQIAWSTLLGGNADKKDQANAITVDADGHVFVVGTTQSGDFPVLNGFDENLGNSAKAFITRIDTVPNAQSQPTASMAWSTLLGDTAALTWSNAEAFGVAVDAAGNVYVTGETTASNFPTQGGFQKSRQTPADLADQWPDGFVTKITPGGQLAWSTYLGGITQGLDIAAGADGKVFVTGMTTSGSFPTGNGFQTVYGTSSDAFVTELDTGTTTGGSQFAAIKWSSYLGGNGEDRARSIAVDNQGRIVLAGFTYSPNFPVANAYDPTHSFTDTGGQGFVGSDGFVTVVTPATTGMPDLVCSISQPTFAGPLMPGDKAKLQVTVTNQGLETVAGKIDLNVSVSSDRTPSNAVLGKLAKQAINLAPGASKTFNFSGKVPNSVEPGQVYFVADIDTALAIAEINEQNNSAATNSGYDLDWAFGNVPGRSGLTRLTVTNPNGNVLTFSLTGPGSGAVDPSGAGWAVALAGSQATTAATISSTIPKWGQPAPIGGFSTEGNLKSLTAKKVAMHGQVHVGGTLGALSLGDMSNGSVDIGADNTVGATLTFGNVVNVNIVSASGFKAFTAASWTGAQGNASSIAAPWVKTMTITKWLTDTQVDIGSRIETLTAGGMMRSDVYAGIADGTSGLPAALENLQAYIKKLTVRGTVKDAGGFSFIASNVAAATITDASVTNLQPEADGPFGFLADTLTKLTVKPGMRKWVALTVAGDTVIDGDAIIRVV